MKDSEKEYLIDEMIKDLDENPEDAWHIINGLKEGYPDDAKEIGQEVIYRMQDRALLEDATFRQSLQEMREGRVDEL
jgi:polyhydroxyalkanoate synthesis regulator phasin